MIPDFGGCPWPMDPACKTDEWESYSVAVQERALALASATLSRLTGYRVGNCSITIRPCAFDPAYAYSRFPFHDGTGFYPTNWNGIWMNQGVCRDGCGAMCEVALPRPVGRVDEVRVDGVVVDPASYRLDNGHLLVWTGPGVCPWPLRQNMNASVTEAGSFAVTFLNAYPVDALGAYAVGILALEFALACSGSKCRLPDGVTSIVRQGITMTVPSGVFPEGMTGMHEVDTFISLWNPKGLQRQAAVWSPDVPQHRTTTYTP